MMMLTAMPCAAEPELTRRTSRCIEESAADTNRGPIVDLRFLDMMHTIQTRLNALGHLPSGWAGRGSEPVSREVRARAALVFGRIGRAAMGLPAVVPGADGSVQLEWRSREYDLEVDVNETVDVFFDNHRGGAIEITDVVPEPKALAEVARAVIAQLK
jgi:hypothetical protein